MSKQSTSKFIPRDLIILTVHVHVHAMFMYLDVVNQACLLHTIYHNSFNIHVHTCTCKYIPTQAQLHAAYLWQSTQTETKSHK